MACKILFSVCVILILNRLIAVAIDQNDASLEENIQFLIKNVSELRKDIGKVDDLQIRLNEEMNARKALEREILNIKENNTVLQQQTEQLQHILQDFAILFQDLANNQSSLQTMFAIQGKRQEEMRLSIDSLMQNHTFLRDIVDNLFVDMQQNLTEMYSEFGQDILHITGDLRQFSELRQNQSVLEQELRKLSVSLYVSDSERQSANALLWNSTEKIKQLLDNVETGLLFNISSLHGEIEQHRVSRKFLPFFVIHYC